MPSDQDGPLGEAVPPIGEPDEAHDDEIEAEIADADADTIEELEQAQEAELRRAHRAYMEAVQFHFGDDAPVAPCPTCEARGYILVQLRADPATERCEDCDGFGVVITGSRVPGNAEQMCHGCQGRGYRQKAGAEQAPQPPTWQPPAVAPLPPSAFDYQPAQVGSSNAA